MINLINYALLAEQKKYGYFNKINEDFGQTAENLKLVLSGEIDDTYIEQWNQLITSIEKNIQKDGSYIVMIKDNNKADMVALTYTITNNKIDIEKDVVVSAQKEVDNWIKERDKNKAAKTSTDKEAAKTSTDKEAATSTGPVTQAIKDAAQKIWVALVGSTFNEEEDDVYAVFKNDIKTDADLQSLLAYWKSLKIPYVDASDPNYSYKINPTSLEKTSQIYTKSTNLTDEKYTLEYWLGSLFSAGEIGKVNSYLAAYPSKTKFDDRGTF